MKAAFYERQGDAVDVLRIGDFPDPLPAHGEVRVKIAFSGLNPSDIKARTGFTGAPMRFPRVIPHQDGSGTIDAVGSGVSEERIGERVWVFKAQTERPFGTAAEYVVLPSRLAVPLGNDASFETGASIGIPAITAHRCLFADGDLLGGRVLVHGGGGGVGTAAILLAKWAGAWVAATVSNETQADAARNAGADVVIFRHSEDVAQRVLTATGGVGVDRIIDVDIVANVHIDLACLATDGVVTAYSSSRSDATLEIPFRPAMFGGHVFRFVYLYSMSERSIQDAVRDISACISARAYSPTIGQQFPLERIVDAHLAQESGTVVGKILVEIGS
ncbi:MULTISPECIES: NADPH:quinone reductase [unclassified Caballeronia]|uniref:NADPH:quinone reductase n=1 Tax=unclassified Caballeronia TaxID=2646786 RepID=UPI002027AE39|nr:MULTISPECIES: NADPH:quinone reductase [unclassified Caballeronia]